MALVTTDLVPPRERATFLSDLVSGQFMDLHARQVGDGLVSGRVRAEMVGELPVTEVGGANLRISRTRAHIARSPLPFYFANVHIAGTSSIRRREQDIDLSIGDVYIVDTLHEFELNAERPHRQLVIRIPKPWLDARVARPDLIPGTVLRHEHPLSRLFTSYVVNGLETAAELSPDAAILFATHAVELLAQALGERPSGEPTPAEALRAALHLRACRLIALRFAEPDLAPSEIAPALGISTRLLQRIFAERGATIMGRVWQERVSRSAWLLASPAAAYRTITEIAFACGFNDSAHFTRAFAARMAMTPSQWCQRAREASPALDPVRKEKGPGANAGASSRARLTLRSSGGRRRAAGAA